MPIPRPAIPPADLPFAIIHVISLRLLEQRVAASHAQARAWRATWRLFLVLGLLGAVPLVVLTPPFQAPDEQQHFFRAYQLSEGSVRSVVREGRAGAELPSSLPALADRFLGTRELHLRRPVTPHPLRTELGSSWPGGPLNPEQREFVDFTGAAFYSPLPYLPQVVAIGVGRAVNAAPLALFYMARLSNAIAALLLLAWSLRILPTGARPAMLFALLPMAVFLYASLSPDALVIAGAFLFTAVMSRGYARGRWTGRDVTTAITAGLLFCSLKPVYAPLLLLALPAILRREHRGHALAVHVLIVGVTLGATALWLWYASSALVPLRAETSVGGQLAFITAEPMQYARVLYWTMLTGWQEYFHELVGVLGWENVELPLAAYALPLAGLLFCLPGSRTENPRPPLTLLTWHAVLVLASALLIMTALYLYWTPVGSSNVDGVQGRYFLPLLAPLAVLLGALSLPTSPSVARGTLVALVVVIVGLLAITQLTVVSAYGRL